MHQTRVGNRSNNYVSGPSQSKTWSSNNYNPSGKVNLNNSTLKIGKYDRRKNRGERNRGLKHLPYAELMEQRSKGLCFRCGEKYHPLYQCIEKQLRLEILGDDETINEEDEVIAIEIKVYEDEC